MKGKNIHPGALNTQTNVRIICRRQVGSCEEVPRPSQAAVEARTCEARGGHLTAEDKTVPCDSEHLAGCGLVLRQGDEFPCTPKHTHCQTPAPTREPNNTSRVQQRLTPSQKAAAKSRLWSPKAQPDGFSHRPRPTDSHRRFLCVSSFLFCPMHT